MGQPTKLTEIALDRARWYWGTRSDPTMAGLARALGVGKPQPYRWLARGKLDIARGKFSIYSRFAREFIKYQEVLDANKAEELARKRRKSAQRRSKVRVPEKRKVFFTQASEQDFLDGLVEFPPRAEVEQTITFTFWPPQTVKGFLNAKRTAIRTTFEPDKPWWRRIFKSDPETWVEPDQYDIPDGGWLPIVTRRGNADLHDEYRFIYPNNETGE